MNRKDIRDQVFARTDWDPSATTTAVDRTNGFVDRVVQQLALDAPILFNESKVRIATEADVEPSGSTDVLVMPADDAPIPDLNVNPWVLKTFLEVGEGTAWETDRSWDGRMIDLTGSDGVVHTNQIRSVWKQTFNGNEPKPPDDPPDDADTIHYMISLVRPIPLQYGLIFAWRVYTSDYYFPDDMIELKAAKVVGGVYPPVKVIGQKEAERLGLDIDNSDAPTAPTPTLMYRRQHVQIPAPNTPPAWDETEVDLDEFPSYAWNGPEPFGEFEYCFTVAWGKQDLDYGAPGLGYHSEENVPWLETSGVSQTDPTRWSANRVREPRFESAPSPVVEATVTSPVEPGDAVQGVVLNFPNMEYMLGFGLSGTYGGAAFRRINMGHSGWHIRIYRRRKTQDFRNYSTLGNGINGVSVTNLRRLDIKDDFFLLAEMRIDEFNGAQFVDNGSIIPDYLRPLRDVHGYQGFRLHPRPQDRKEIEVRCIRRPARICSDADVPPIHSEAVEVVIERVLAMVLQTVGDTGGSQVATARANDLLTTIRKRYGDLRPSDTPTYRRSAGQRNRTGFPQDWRIR